MKKQHVVVLGATYRPFEATDVPEEGLTSIEAPKNWKDEEKKAARVKEKMEKRQEELAELWPTKRFQSLRVCYYDGSGKEPLIVQVDPVEAETNFISLLKPICDELAKADESQESILFVGVAVRDILRILLSRHGVDGLLPYQRIADQREVIDVIGMLHTGEVAKHLDSLYLLRNLGIKLDGDYAPSQSSTKDCNLALQVYNTLCRARSQAQLAL